MKINIVATEALSHTHLQHRDRITKKEIVEIQIWREGKKKKNIYMWKTGERWSWMMGWEKESFFSKGGAEQGKYWEGSRGSTLAWWLVTEWECCPTRSNSRDYSHQTGHRNTETLFHIQPAVWKTPPYYSLVQQRHLLSAQSLRGETTAFHAKLHSVLV